MLQKFTVGKSVWTMYKDFVCISCKISLSLKIIKNKKKSLSCVQVFAMPWATESMDFSRPEYWMGCLSLLKGIFLT